MKMIFIYGPPASGKLTIAEEILRIKDYKLFHNHLTIDLAKSLFEFGSDAYKKYCNKLRLEYIEMAAKNNIDLIFTFCYVPIESDDEFVRKVIKIIKKHRSKIYFIHLQAERKILHKRVKSSSRIRYHKVKTSVELERMLSKHDFYTKISFVDSYYINNSYISPILTARKIMRYCNKI